MRTFVYPYQPSSDETWVCARVEDTTSGEGFGGRLEVTPDGVVPSVSGGVSVPATDSNSTLCTATTDPPNQVPGPHPISSGGILTVEYLLDAYAGGSEAWLCLQAGSTELRVVVPVEDPVPGVEFGTAVTWEPDEGTPPS